MAATRKDGQLFLPAGWLVATGPMGETWNLLLVDLVLGLFLRWAAPNDPQKGALILARICFTLDSALTYLLPRGTRSVTIALDLARTCPSKFYFQKSSSCENAEPGGACKGNEARGGAARPSGAPGCFSISARRCATLARMQGCK